MPKVQSKTWTRAHEEKIDKLALINEVFDAVFDRCETFREDNVGADLAYLLGAISDPKGSFVDWSKDAYDGHNQLYTILILHFPPRHDVWKFIKL